MSESSTFPGLLMSHDTGASGVDSAFQTSSISSSSVPKISQRSQAASETGDYGFQCGRQAGRNARSIVIQSVVKLPEYADRGNIDDETLRTNDIGPPFRCNINHKYRHEGSKTVPDYSSNSVERCPSSVIEKDNQSDQFTVSKRCKVLLYAACGLFVVFTATLALLASTGESFNDGIRLSFQQNSSLVSDGKNPLWNPPTATPTITVPTASHCSTHHHRPYHRPTHRPSPAIWEPLSMDTTSLDVAHQFANVHRIGRSDTKNRYRTTAKSVGVVSMSRRRSNNLPFSFLDFVIGTSVDALDLLAKNPAFVFFHHATVCTK